MAEGAIKERPFYFSDSERDDFDTWNSARDQEIGLARTASARYLQGGYEDYEYELTRNGRWNYMNSYGSYVWIPYNLDPEWQPYANGHWVWSPFYGYVWVSYDPWGWFTHHYGRWHWDAYDGWCWVPGYHWSPAWVSWFWDDTYCSWAPLSWWNRPIIVINNRWDHTYDYHNGIPTHCRSAVVIRKDDFMAPHINRVALPTGQHALGVVRSLAPHAAPPFDKPVVVKTTVINARGEAQSFKQNSLVSDAYKGNGGMAGNSTYSTAPAGKALSSKYSGGSKGSAPVRSTVHSTTPAYHGGAASSKKKHDDEEQADSGTVTATRPASAHHAPDATLRSFSAGGASSSPAAATSATTVRSFTAPVREYRAPETTIRSFSGATTSSSPGTSATLKSSTSASSPAAHGGSAPAHTTTASSASNAEAKTDPKKK
jgi:hypothetical protein